MSTLVTPASAYAPMPTMDSGWDRTPRNARFIRQYASVATTSSPLHIWAEKYNEQGDAEFIGEGEVKPPISFSIRTRDSKAKKIAVSAKFTTETMQDIPNFLAELKSEILEVVDIKEESGLLNGDGIGDNLLGVIQQATTYVLTTVFTAGANNFDAIKAAITQLFTLNQIPNVVFVNPIDKANMELTKASDGHYILPPFSTVDGTIISGVRVVESNSVTVGKFLLGDWSKLNIRDYIAFEITLGWENDDFTKNLVTVIGEKRLMSYIKEHQKTAFIYGDFATIKAAIEEV
jgi:HK97 family phage major capsid protein